MQQVKVVPLKPADLLAAATALAKAFQDDPLQSYVFPDPQERAAKSPAHFSPLVAYGLRFGRVFTTDPQILGVSIWLPPEGWEVTPERAAEAGLDRLPELLGQASADRFFSVLGYADSFHKTDVPPAHWYTMILGVAPEGRGRGLGRALMQPILTVAAADDLPCYLETAQPSNVSFYEHLGFRVVRESVEPTSKLKLWTFRRDPRIGEL